MDNYGVKIYYERESNIGETIEDEVKYEYRLNTIPTLISLLLYRKGTSQVVDKIDYKSADLSTSKRIEALNTFEYISDLIREGESKTVEFKGFQNYNKISVRKDELCETVLSFANTSGGITIIGVKDDKRIIGFKDQTQFDKLKKDLTNLIDGNCEPLITCFMEIVQTDKGENLLIIHVQKGNNPPYIRKGNNGIFIRINDLDRDCSRVELDHLISSKNENLLT
ncbi:AlbA family DNA-binding domain-containing protein [Candidatus Nitrosocosmicus sp. R]